MITQGFFVALLYCFLNGEVQSEVKKWWTIHKPTIFDHRSLHHLGGHGCHGNHGENGNGNHGGEMNGNGHNNFPHSITYNSLLTQSMNHLAGKIMMTNSNTLPNISGSGSHLVRNGTTQSDPHVHSFPRGTSGHGDPGTMDMVPLNPIFPKSCGASPIGHELLEPLVSKATCHESCFNKDGHWIVLRTFNSLSTNSKLEISILSDLQPSELSIVAFRKDSKARSCIKRVIASRWNESWKEGNKSDGKWGDNPQMGCYIMRNSTLVSFLSL